MDDVARELSSITAWRASSGGTALLSIAIGNVVVPPP